MIRVLLDVDVLFSSFFVGRNLCCKAMESVFYGTC